MFNDTIPKLSETKEARGKSITGNNPQSKAEQHCLARTEHMDPGDMDALQKLIPQAPGY